VLLSSGDSFPHLIQKPMSQLGFVSYLLNYLRNNMALIHCQTGRVFEVFITYNPYLP
jgi:hypothetical protein